MNNLTTYQTPFSFLAIQPQTQKSIPNCCGLAWIYDSFHLSGNNYYLYTCQRGERRIKQGVPAKEVLNWGGQDV